MNVDFKITTWERVEIAPEDEAKVLDAIKSGEVSTANDLIEFVENANYIGKIDETDEQMTPEDNGGCSTIEVLDDNGNTILTNATNL